MILSDTTKAIFNSLNEGITIIDTDEVIVFANNKYKDFIAKEKYPVDPEKIEGMKLRVLRPGAYLPEVLITGKPLMQKERKEVSDPYFVNMYPILDQGKIIGGISVITFMRDATNFRAKIEDLERRNRQIIQRVNSARQTDITFDSIISRSKKSRDCKEYAMKMAAIDAPLLLMCESGTGKDLYAHAIHNEGTRSKEVFASINCATFDSRTIKSELFGYIPGAFTGAKDIGKIGLFEAATGGTIFIDEISELEMEVQGMLVYVLQHKAIRKVGSDEDIPVDVRIIAASNVDLQKRVQEGRFRDDLYYMLSSFMIRIPPLRERMEDLPLLANEFVAKASLSLKRKITLSDNALEVLMAHTWPGNIRELRSVLESSAYIASDGMITAVNLPDNIGKTARHTTMPLFDRVKEFEKMEILKTLEFYGNGTEGKKAAAKELGISLASLYSKLK